ncbi:MAG TPA: hypothetical protein VMN60_11765 [Longimicrobiales bacterium]|nr:hypothetical protein [Longimicrobiales bacterium]
MTRSRRVLSLLGGCPLPASLSRTGAMLLAFLTVSDLPAAAQSDEACEVRLSGADFVGASADLSRMLDLQQPESLRSFLIRRISDRVVVDACTAPGAVAEVARNLSLPPVPDIGAVLLPADVRILYNGTYPRDWNDGAMRGGAGLSTSFTAGAEFRFRALEGAIVPVVTWHSNAGFALIPFADPATYSRWIHPWHGRFIDLPQRFGSTSNGGIDAGQSYLRVNVARVRAGISHENLAWGPARRNPLLLSGTAPGFAHVFIESARPHDLWLASAEFQVFWGRLEESDYFDYDADNDRRALAGAMATLRPRGLEGLYLGAGHLHMQTWSPNTSAGELLFGPYAGIDPDSSGLPRDLRLFTLFMRWASAPAGLEVYGEWARQDHWKQWVRLLNPLDAAQAYTLGLQKVVRRGDNAIRFSAEVSHLSDNISHPDLGRGINTYYVSPHVPQGHTHRGQLLGAPIGPGSESQFMGTDVFWRHGRSSLSVERVRYDDDAYYAVWAQTHGPHGHDTEMSFRAAHLFAMPLFSVEAELGYSFRYNRSLLGLHHSNHPGFPYRKENNIGLRLSGRVNPPSWTWTR